MNSAQRGKTQTVDSQDAASRDEGLHGETLPDQKHKPVIGIVPTRLPEPYDDGINRYALAVENAGGKPFILPITDDVAAYETIFPHMDGFLLTGGKDIDPVRYETAEDDPTLTDHLPGREELEHLILSYADEFDVPLLGICRGMQMLNIFYGGSLHLDLQSQTSVGTQFGNHFQTTPFDQTSHHVSIDPEGRIGRILHARDVQVNSMHHQGVYELADELRADAFDDNGLIEAIEHPDKPFAIGVQWHPEFLGKTSSMNLLFEAFIEASREEAKRKRAKRENIAIDRIHTGLVWPQVSFIDRQPKITAEHADAASPAFVGAAAGSPAPTPAMTRGTAPVPPKKGRAERGY